MLFRSGYSPQGLPAFFYPQYGGILNAEIEIYNGGTTTVSGGSGGGGGGTGTTTNGTTTTSTTTPGQGGGGDTGSLYKKSNLAGASLLDGFLSLFGSFFKGGAGDAYASDEVAPATTCDLSFYGLCIARSVPWLSLFGK